MRIINAGIFSYELPLIRPFNSKGRHIEKRRGVLISVSGDSGLTGWGEMAPLPGFSPESIRQVADCALWLKPILIGREIPSQWLPLERDLSWLPQPEEWPASVRFGIELALWNLGLQSAPHTSVARHNHHDPLLLISGLLSGAPDEVVKQAQALAGAGYRAVKVKVGDKPVQEDVQVVLKVRSAIGGGIALRIDANRSWDLADALKFARGVTAAGVEYIEEPVIRTEDLTRFADRCDLPLALDETLLELPLKRLVMMRGLKAVVLKPTLLGGLYRTVTWAQRARQLGITPVLSSAFESGVGILGLARLAAMTCEGTTVGLDTYRWLAQDVVSPRLATGNGFINLDHIDVQSHTIDFRLLTDLADG